jgi:hypothetical protein
VAFVVPATIGDDAPVGGATVQLKNFRMCVLAPLNSPFAPVTAPPPRRARPGLLLGANLDSCWRELEFWLWRLDLGAMEPGHKRLAVVALFGNEHY